MKRIDQIAALLLAAALFWLMAGQLIVGAVREQHQKNTTEQVDSPNRL